MLLSLDSGGLRRFASTEVRSRRTLLCLLDVQTLHAPALAVTTDHVRERLRGETRTAFPSRS